MNLSLSPVFSSWTESVLILGRFFTTQFNLMDKLYENEHVHVSVCVWTAGTCCPSPWLCSGYSWVQREKFNIPPQCIHNEGGIATMVRNKREREREGGRREQQLLINLSASALQSSQSNCIFTLYPSPPTHIHTQCEHVLFHTFDSACGQIN